MGERVKWATTQDGNCAHAALYSKGVRASVWADGDWRLFDNADSMIANGKAEPRTLEAAKLAAEAALRERGLVGGEVPSPLDIVAGPGAALAGQVTEMLRELAPFGGVQPRTADAIAADMRKQMNGVFTLTAPRRGTVVCGIDGGTYAPVRSHDAIATEAAFAALAAAMQTPQGRRVLAAQAVEGAVADGARRGLDAEALRVALVGAVEAHASGIMVDVSGLVVDAVDNIMQQRRDYPHEREDCDRYRRALAARSAKPLGRPPQRRGVRGREW